MKTKTIIITGILLGIVLSIPISFKLIQWKSENRGVVVNNWRVSFRTGNYGSNYLLRAAIATHSLGNAIPEEAMFFHGFFDHNGDKLNGTENSYQIHFNANSFPPVNAFWSVTLYDSDGFLVENPLNKYSLSDSNPDLQFNEDGSLDLYFQNRAPDKSKTTNWIPAPKEEFTLTLRAYLPKKKLLDLEWKAPFIQKTNKTN